MEQREKRESKYAEKEIEHVRERWQNDRDRACSNRKKREYMCKF